jgi:hypothetical protein
MAHRFLDRPFLLAVANHLGSRHAACLPLVTGLAPCSLCIYDCGRLSPGTKGINCCESKRRITS